MKAPIIETPSGTVNGVNRTYQTAAEYRRGSVRVWVNGLLQEESLEDGFQELPPNRFMLNEPPEAGDTVQVYYLPL